MRYGTAGQFEVARLADELGVERWGAIGILESLRHLAIQCDTNGELAGLSEAGIAFYVGWKGKPEILVKALLFTSWLGIGQGYIFFLCGWPIRYADATGGKDK